MESIEATIQGNLRIQSLVFVIIIVNFPVNLNIVQWAPKCSGPFQLSESQKVRMGSWYLQGYLKSP